MQPEIFAFGDDDGPTVKVDPIEGDDAAMARDAITMCPSRALSLAGE